MTALGRIDRPARGVSLVEMMVAIVLGLFLVGAGAALLVGQIGEQRRRLAEVRLTQELRGAAALIERDLRRAGHWAGAFQSVWTSAAGASSPANPYVEVYPLSGDAAMAGYAYSRDATENGIVDSNERFGFRINGSTRTLEMRLGGNALVPAAGDGWQALTDPALVRITRLAFTVTPSHMDLAARCTSPCAPGSASCPPLLTLRSVAFEIEGASPADVTLTQVLRRTVRVRADASSGACPPA